MRLARTKSAKRMWRIAGLFSTVGIEMVVGFVIGIFGGQWLDRHFETGSLFFYLGLVLGVGVVISTLRRVLRTTKRLMRQAEEDPMPETLPSPASFFDDEKKVRRRTPPRKEESSNDTW